MRYVTVHLSEAMIMHTKTEHLKEEENSTLIDSFIQISKAFTES